jgi:beta-N-acetylhexosaminidase
MAFRRARAPVLTALLAGFAASCGSGSAPPPAPPPGPAGVTSEGEGAAPVASRVSPAPQVEPAPAAPPETPPPAADLPDPEDLSPSEWADRVLAGLTLREKVGQMIMPRILGDFTPEGSESFEDISDLVERDEIGGIIVAVGTPMDVATKLNLLQRRSKLPLLVASDLETGAGFRLHGAAYLPGATDLGGATEFPPLMAVGATGDRWLAYEMGRVTAEEARAVGIQVPFAPVLDVNNNPENPVINVRSFGEDPERVADLGVCFVRGIQEHGALATGKHFPGHGDTDTDSHTALPVIRVGRDRLEAVELVPFRRAIEAGMGGVMTAHIALPGVTETPELPATLSPNVVTGLLRGELGFDGLVFTDAMNMSAIDQLFGSGEAATRAVEAGADFVLMPPDPGVAIGAVVDAVLSGRVAESRIDDSVRRILQAKAELGLDRERTVDLEAVYRRVGIEDHLEVARAIAERSVTLLRNERDLLPLAGTGSASVLSITYRSETNLLAGRAFDDRLRETYPRLRTAVVGEDTAAEDYASVLRDAGRTDLVVLSLYISEISTDEKVAGTPELMDFIGELSRSSTPHVVVSFGNPYLIAEFPDVRAYLVAWGAADVSQRAAAGALLGEISVTGRSPVRIPPDFEIGAGIQMPARQPATASEGRSCP